MRKLTIKLLLAATAFAASAQEKPAPLAQEQPDPITDRIRYEVAAAQRDYLLAKAQMDAATKALTEKIAAAQKACGEKQFDTQAMACVEGKK